MRRILLLLLLVSLGLNGNSRAADATGRVIKVLPLLLNQAGHDALSPSLFDRDAYQMYLRLHTNEIAAIRFDVLWKASRPPVAPVKIRAELRAIAGNGDPRLLTLEQSVKPGYFRHWASLDLSGTNYQTCRNLVAWRVTLWSGDHLLDEQKSFLW